MILVDTSVWIDHTRKPNPTLQELLSQSEVLCHPFVVGELACGNLPNRAAFLRMLRNLEQPIGASHANVLTLIERHPLMGRGLGIVDVHLLAAAMITPVSRLWSVDRAMVRAARELGISYD